MQLYEEAGGGMGARHFSWMKLAVESRVKNGAGERHTVVSVQMSSQRNSV